MTEFSCNVTTADFERRVLQASQKTPVLADFWAAWCAPCKTLTPILEKLADAYQGRFLLAKIDTEANPELTEWFGIRSIPTVALFMEGRPVDGFSGALPESDVRAFLDRLLPPREGDPRDLARERSASGDKAGAIAILDAALAKRPDNENLRLDRAMLALETNAPEDAKNLLAYTFQAETERANALRSQLNFMLNASLGPSKLAELKTETTGNPDNHAARLKLARALAANGAYDEALEAAIEVVRRDRHYNGEEAQKLLLEFFRFLEAYPEHDGLIRRYRRLLSALLH